MRGVVVGRGGGRGEGGVEEELKKLFQLLSAAISIQQIKINWQFNAPVCTKAHAADNSKSHFWREIIDLFDYFVMENMLLHHILFFSYRSKKTYVHLDSFILTAFY